MGRGDLTDAQWARLESLLPVGVKPGRPPARTKRQLIDGIRWWPRAGVPWRDVPGRYGPWETVYGLFRRWLRDGTWARILERFQARADAEGLVTWDVNIDSTVCQVTVRPLPRPSALNRRCSTWCRPYRVGGVRLVRTPPAYVGAATGVFSRRRLRCECPRGSRRRRWRLRMRP
ncbi:transposase [Streptodolium elevatio]|uniref:Transposase n=1 Tax=Streptodolium elevatio TaxID=3157996 RepID=A0ABV3DTY8_9ACTN